MRAEHMPHEVAPDKPRSARDLRRHRDRIYTIAHAHRSPTPRVRRHDPQAAKVPPSTEPNPQSDEYENHRDHHAKLSNQRSQKDQRRRIGHRPSLRVEGRRSHTDGHNPHECEPDGQRGFDRFALRPADPGQPKSHNEGDEHIPIAFMHSPIERRPVIDHGHHNDDRTGNEQKCGQRALSRISSLAAQPNRNGEEAGKHDKTQHICHQTDSCNREVDSTRQSGSVEVGREPAARRPDEKKIDEQKTNEIRDDMKNANTPFSRAKSQRSATRR